MLQSISHGHAAKHGVCVYKEVYYTVGLVLALVWVKSGMPSNLVYIVHQVSLGCNAYNYICQHLCMCTIFVSTVGTFVCAGIFTRLS